MSDFNSFVIILALLGLLSLHGLAFILLLSHLFKLRTSARSAGTQGLHLLIAATAYEDALVDLIIQVEHLGLAWRTTADRDMEFALLRAQVEQVIRANPDLAKRWWEAHSSTD